MTEVIAWVLVLVLCGALWATVHTLKQLRAYIARLEETVKHLQLFK